MKWYTHMTGGIVIGTLIQADPLGMVIIAGSALLPDIDSHHSKLGRKILPVSWLIEKTVGHRGFFHSLLATLLITVLLWFIYPQYALYVGLGYLSHLLLDSFNPGGVPLLWPYKKKFRLPLTFKVGSLGEFAVLISLIGVYALNYI